MNVEKEITSQEILDVELAMLSLLEAKEFLEKEGYLVKAMINTFTRSKKEKHKLVPTKKFIDFFNKEPSKKLVDKAGLLLEFEAFYELIPIVKLPTNHYLRGSKNDVKKKFLAFRKQYPEFDFDLIVEVTLAWIREFEAESWKYCQTVSNFISKNGESQLSSYCQNYADASNSRRTVNTYNPTTE